MKENAMKYYSFLFLLLAAKNGIILALNADADLSSITTKRKLQDTVIEKCVGAKCLQVIKTAVAVHYDGAYNACISLGGSFATIDSLAEHDAVFSTGLCDRYFINIRQTGGPGSAWLYRDKNGIYHPYGSYRKWSANQPQHNHEDCAQIYPDNGWHDMGCNAYPTQCYVCTETSAGGGGDPHFNAFGDILFSWQGHCDAVLAKVPGHNKTNTGLEIHIRTKKVRKWSSIDAIAVKAGQNVIEIGSDEGKLLLNGSVVESVEDDFLAVSLTKVKKRMISYEFVFEGDKKLHVKVNTRSKMIFVNLSGNYPYETVGILGSPHRPGLFARNGSDMTGKDVNKFVESWQVRDDDPQLFLTAREPKFPTKCFYDMGEIKEVLTNSRRLKERRKISMEEAFAACDTHNPGPLKTFCVEDMMETGDFDSAQDEFYG